MGANDDCVKKKDKNDESQDIKTKVDLFGEEDKQDCNSATTDTVSNENIGKEIESKQDEITQDNNNCKDVNLNQVEEAENTERMKKISQLTAKISQLSQVTFEFLCVENVHQKRTKTFYLTTTTKFLSFGKVYLNS